jgi:Predicted solute binding protein
MSSPSSESASPDPVSEPIISPAVDSSASPTVASSTSPAVASTATSSVTPTTAPSVAPTASSFSSTTAMNNPSVSNTSNASFRPVDHHMGKYRESYPGKGDWFAVSGGIPKADWSGIATNRRFNPKQSHPVDAYEQSKLLLDKRCEGVLPKFKAGNSLTEFKNSLFEAFIERGLDTITYLPDLSTFKSDPINSKMFSTIEHYSRFCLNPEKSKEVARHYQDTFFDDFDNQNSDAAKRLLFNSIDSTILSKLKQSLKMSDCFNVAWITFLGLQLSTSSKHYDDLRKKLREIDVQKYPLQNVADLCLDIHPVIKELENANQYQPSLTLAILQRVRATCTQDLQFPVKLDLMTIEVEQAVKTVSFLSNEDANAAMATHDPKLDPDSVLQFLKEAHNDLLKDGLWKPANRPRDTGTVPAALVSPPGSNSSDQKSDGEGRLTKALKVLLQLDRASLSSKKDGKKTPENSPCNICGKLGHWAPKCPDKNKSSASSSNGSNLEQSSTSRTGNRSWKRTPPGPNDPQTKKVNRTNFFWCAKCNRWSTSHGTDQHKKKESQAITQSASLAIDPGVWLVADHEVMYKTSSGLAPGFLVSVVGFVAVLGMFWLFNCGYTSRVVGSSVGFTHAFMSLAQHFSNDQVNSKVMALSTMVKQLFNNDIIHMGKSTASVLYSLKDVTGTILCHAKQLPLSVFVAPCLWLSTLLVLVTKGPSKISLGQYSTQRKLR